MNVRLTLHGEPNPSLLWVGITRVLSDGETLTLMADTKSGGVQGLNWPLKRVAEIRLDEEPGDIF